MALLSIPHSRPDIGYKEIRAVTGVLKTGIIAYNGEVKKFEENFRKLIKRKYTAALNSGTSALHLSLLALGVNNCSEVILPSYVCPALLNAVNYTGAVPVIADVRPEDGNISAESVRIKITSKTKAVIVPHMFGMPVNVREITALGIPVVEDCAQSLGADFNGKITGQSGKISVFSFYTTKVLATGEGGMTATDDSKLAGRIKDLRSYDGKNDYKIRYNYKMTDLSASLGNVQLSRLRKFVERRRKIADLYRKKIYSPVIHHPLENKKAGNIYFRYVVAVKKGGLPEIVEMFRKRKISAQMPVFKPIHRYLGLDKREFPGTEECCKKFLSLPIYPSLTDKEVERVINTSLEVFSEKQ